MLLDKTSLDETSLDETSLDKNIIRQNIIRWNIVRPTGVVPPYYVFLKYHFFYPLEFTAAICLSTLPTWRRIWSSSTPRRRRAPSRRRRTRHESTISLIDWRRWWVWRYVDFKISNCRNVSIVHIKIKMSTQLVYVPYLT
jgi:hypothetical protein